jgi:hypothetical protein
MSVFPPIHAACFVTPHGFGHAARACAVMEAVHELAPASFFEVYTRVPEAFFAESLSGSFAWHECLTDIGIAQNGPLEPDLAETVRRLDGFLPLHPGRVNRLAREIGDRGCRLALCDIAPLGIAVAREAGIPSVLLENFTWDWIYADHPVVDGLNRHAALMGELFQQADHRIQAEPVCERAPGAPAVPPVSRKPRTTRAEVREALGLPPDRPLVLVTMGGVPGSWDFFDRLRNTKDVRFLFPGGAQESRTEGNLTLLSPHSGFYHPDLIHAADAVVGKAGYSTLAEVHAAGVPFGYVLPGGFRESPVLAEFARRRLPGHPVPEPRFQDGSWVDDLPALLSLPQPTPRPHLGAEAAARLLLEIARGAGPNRRESP